MSHRHTNTVAHTEVAMEAGRDYESPHEGHKQMYNNVEDLMKKRDEPIHEARKMHRGARIDHELEEEEQAEIAKKEHSKAQHQQHSKKKHH